MHQLTEQYKKEIGNYEDCKRKIESLIQDLLIEHKISFHKIEARVKDIGRLDEKINRKDGKYTSLSEITDLVGIRIITYFEDDVDKIANVIQQEFIVDKENSIDKRQLESDRFGYKSLHYVVSISDSRSKLSEYKKFKNIKVEIQIRSVLQHAWAEIEHDIGYKSEHAIPNAFKRDFYRVAALLETVDIEFVKIKIGLNEYENNIDVLIAKQPEKVEINLASLRAFLLNNETSHRIDKKLTQIINEGYDKHLLVMTEILVERLKFLNINSIKELENLLIANENYIVKFAQNWFSQPDNSTIEEYGPLSNGIGIFYLSYVLIGEKNDISIAKRFETMFMDDDDTDPHYNAEGIIDTYKKIISS